MYELYADEQMTTLIAQSETADIFWTTVTPLQDNSWFFWRVKAIDEHLLQSDWTLLTSFFVNNSGFDDSPSIALTAPIEDIPDASLRPVTISWSDEDPDSNATISLYYDTDTANADGTLIISGIQEDQDGSADSYVWDTSSLQPGSYYIYAVISDATSSSTVYLSTRITIVATLDRDGDGVADSVDNCVATPNADQKDSGGVGSISPDGIGDACQCGDVSGDGKITNTDSILLRRHLLGLPSPFKAAYCDVNGDGQCTNTDAVLIQRSILGLPPGLSQSCTAAGN
jgi:hypothetical protein